VNQDLAMAGFVHVVLFDSKRLTQRFAGMNEDRFHRHQVAL
jgi:hypothetical protein